MIRTVAICKIGQITNGFESRARQQNETEHKLMTSSYLAPGALDKLR